MYRPPKISERLSAAHAQGHGQPERGVRAGNGVAVVGTRSAVGGNGDGGNSVLSCGLGSSETETSVCAYTDSRAANSREYLLELSLKER